MNLYYDHGGIQIYHGDCREFETGEEYGALVLDPPWDDWGLVDELDLGPILPSIFAFCDSRRNGEVISRLGAPSWIFVWDTMSPWTTGDSRPLTQTKFCFWYGQEYDRDAELWGEAPPAKDHPSTQSVPLKGRRLTDIWRESLRWLHNPAAGVGSNGKDRFWKDRKTNHAKPVGWIQCLLGNGSTGPVFDPFMGSGTTLRAAKNLNRKAVGIELDERLCEVAANSLAQEVFNFD